MDEGGLFRYRSEDGGIEEAEVRNRSRKQGRSKKKKMFLRREQNTVSLLFVEVTGSYWEKGKARNETALTVSLITGVSMREQSLASSFSKRVTGLQEERNREPVKTSGTC